MELLLSLILSGRLFHNLGAAALNIRSPKMDVQTHDLYDDGAMLYQLNYKATQLGAGQFLGLMCSVKGMMNERIVFMGDLVYDPHFTGSNPIETSENFQVSVKVQ